MLTDPAGLPITTDQPAIAAAIAVLERELLSYGRGAADIHAAAAVDPNCALAAALSAAIHLATLTRDGFAAAAPLIARAEATAGQATPRERLYVAAIAAWAREDGEALLAAHAALAQGWPADLLAAKLHQFHLLNLGRYADMAAFARRTLAARPESSFALGMAAFALAQSGERREAERLGRAAADLAPDPWAAHAVAHVLDDEGRAAEGRAWMAARGGDWDGCSSFMLTHNWWHAALFELDLGEPDAALAIYDARVWGVRKTSCQDQINAVSLLARLALRGIDVSDRWSDLADHVAPRAGDRVLGFLDLQYLLALLHAGRDAAADAMLADLADRARAPVPGLDGQWAAATLPAAEAIVAHARGNHDLAVARFRVASPRLARLGGSRTQRDLFRRLAAEAQRRAGAGSPCAA